MLQDLAVFETSKTLKHKWNLLGWFWHLHEFMFSQFFSIKDRIIHTKKQNPFVGLFSVKYTLTGTQM